MKRSKPLARTVSLKRGATLTRGKPLARGKALSRLPSAKALTRRKAAAPYLTDVRSLSCVASGFSTCAGDVVAAHMTLSANEKSTGKKVNDSQVVPMCCRHHDEADGRAQPRFTDGWTREQRFELAARWVQETTERVKTLRLGRELGES